MNNEEIASRYKYVHVDPHTHTPARAHAFQKSNKWTIGEAEKEPGDGRRASGTGRLPPFHPLGFSCRWHLLVARLVGALQGGGSKEVEVISEVRSAPGEREGAEEGGGLWRKAAASVLRAELQAAVTGEGEGR